MNTSPPVSPSKSKPPLPIDNNSKTKPTPQFSILSQLQQAATSLFTVQPTALTGSQLNVGNSRGGGGNDEKEGFRSDLDKIFKKNES